MEQHVQLLFSTQGQNQTIHSCVFCKISRGGGEQINLDLSFVMYYVLYFSVK